MSEYKLRKRILELEVTIKLMEKKSSVLKHLIHILSKCKNREYYEPKTLLGIIAERLS